MVFGPRYRVYFGAEPLSLSYAPLFRIPVTNEVSLARERPRSRTGPINEYTALPHYVMMQTVVELPEFLWWAKQVELTE